MQSNGFVLQIKPTTAALVLLYIKVKRGLMTSSISLFSVLLLLVTQFFFSTAQAAARQVEIEGEVEVQIEDHAQGAKTRYYLKSKSGEVLELLSGKANNRLQPKAKVKVRGQRRENYLALDGAESVIVISNPPLPRAVGQRKIAILFLNFQNNKVEPFVLNDGNNALIALDKYMRETSWNITSVTGSTFGWYTLPLDTTCDRAQISTAGRQAAANAGVDLTLYDHVMYFTPQNSSCGWAGVASIRGSSIWINGTLRLQVLGHELGHNFGLYHSHSKDCGSSVTSGTCTVFDYGDSLDIMGNSKPAHFNAFQKERMGWLNYSNTPPIVTATNSGIYSISPYEIYSTAPKALKVLKSTDSATGLRTYYYIEFRQPIGADSFISTLTSTNILKGVIVRLGTEGSPNSSYLLDMTPASTAYSNSDWQDLALEVGKSYEDFEASVTITPTAISSAGAAIEVKFGAVAPPPPQVCVRANPAVSPISQTKSAIAGSAVSYTITVTNMDSIDCGSSFYSLQAIAPSSSWSATLGSSLLSLAPGTRASVLLTLKSPISATAATYEGKLQVTNNAASASTSVASAFYTVSGTAAPAPVCTRAAPVLTPSSQTKSASAGTTLIYTLTLTNKDSADCGSSVFNLQSIAPSSFIAGTSASSLSLAPGSSASFNLSLQSSIGVSAATYATQVKAINSVSAQSASALAYYTVLAPPPAPVPTLLIALSTDKSLYAANSTVAARAVISSSGLAVSGASVTFQFIDPTGKVISKTVIADVNGVAVLNYRISRKSAKGIYQLKVNAVGNSLSATASTTFTVQ